MMDGELSMWVSSSPVLSLKIPGNGGSERGVPHCRVKGQAPKCLLTQPQYSSLQHRD